MSSLDHGLKDKDPQQIRWELRGDAELTNPKRDGLTHASMAPLKFSRPLLDSFAKVRFEILPSGERGLNKLSFLGRRYIRGGLRIYK
jgi:hypothetical protein